MVHLQINNRKTGKPALLSRWMDGLVVSVAKTFDVKSYHSRSRGRKCTMTFHGIYTNAQLAGYSFKVAAERISQMAVEYKPEKAPWSKTSTKSSRLSYALGIVRGIAKEVDENIEMEKEKLLRKLERARSAVAKGEAHEESDDEDAEGELGNGADDDDHDGPGANLPHTPDSEDFAKFTAKSPARGDFKRNNENEEDQDTTSSKPKAMAGEELDRRLRELENENQAALVLVDHNEKVAEEVLKDNDIKLYKGRKRKSMQFDRTAYDQGIEDSKEIDINQRALRDEVKVKKGKRE